MIQFAMAVLLILLLEVQIPSPAGTEEAHLHTIHT